VKEYNVYIDESGDEGISRGSKYFILTAILVDKKNDLVLARKVDDLKKQLRLDLKKQLHWNKIKGYSNKLEILSFIKKMDLSIINIIIDTSKIRLIHSNTLYYHFSGYLYERICWYVRDRKAVANLFISSRGDSLSKAKLTEFLQIHPKKFTIDYSKINEIKIIPNANKRLLQIADCCCSSLGQALKYKNDLHYHYISFFSDKFYTYSNKYVGYGLKYVPGNLENPLELQDLIAFLEQRKK